MNILFFLTPKNDVAYIFENETLRQTIETIECTLCEHSIVMNKDKRLRVVLL